MIKLLLFLSTALALLWAALRLRGHSQWRRTGAALLQRLRATRAPSVPAIGDDTVVNPATMPAPVQRWFALVLPDPIPTEPVLVLQHRGEFNTRSEGERWAAFTSTQHVLLTRPGFLWDARIRMFPGLPVHVHDAYLDGEGRLHAALLGLFTLADLADREGLAEGELMRWIAEAAWYPWVLRPGPNVAWSAVDDQHADVTVHDGPLSITLRFGFDAGGLLRSVRSESRARSVGGEMVPTPWEGIWSDYRKIDGRLLPMAGEVAWLLPNGRKPYWRGIVTDVQLP